MLSLLRSRVDPAVPHLHAAIVTASRNPLFYTAGQVPDTLDGRFELLALHAFLVLRRLRGENAAMAQNLFDAVFAHFDLNLRELGVGDMGVGKRIRFMAESFYGRLSAYERGLADPGLLHEALARNLFGTLPEEPAPSLTRPFADYLRAGAAVLERTAAPDLLRAGPLFPDFSGFVHEEARA